MTVDQERLVAEVGWPTVEIFNIAHGHDKSRAPCTCTVCRVTLYKCAQWLKKFAAGKETDR